MIYFWCGQERIYDFVKGETRCRMYRERNAESVEGMGYGEGVGSGSDCA